MVFFKRNKSKMMIGTALLVIATGALGILKTEETKLKRELVGCESFIREHTKK